MVENAIVDSDSGVYKSNLQSRVEEEDFGLWMVVEHRQTGKMCGPFEGRNGDNHGGVKGSQMLCCRLSERG